MRKKIKKNPLSVFCLFVFEIHIFSFSGFASMASNNSGWFDLIDAKAAACWSVTREQLAHLKTRFLSSSLSHVLEEKGLCSRTCPLKGSRLVCATYAGASVLLKFLPILLINTRNSIRLENLKFEDSNSSEKKKKGLPAPLADRMMNRFLGIGRLCYFLPKASMFLIPGTELLLLSDWRSGNSIRHWVPLSDSVFWGHDLPSLHWYSDDESEKAKIRALHSNQLGLYVPFGSCRSWESMIENLYLRNNKGDDLRSAIPAEQRTLIQ